MLPHDTAYLRAFILARVNRSGACWLWQRSTNQDGYGHARINGKTRRIHRLAYELWHGPIPAGVQVLHNCPGGDNPLCCNPDHLWLGTHTDNMRDRQEKGRGLRSDGDNNPSRLYPERQVRGEQCHKARLTADQVREIRKLYENGQFYQHQLAEMFGVAQPTIGCIVLRKTWKHIA